jgi:hypothetical protein
VSLLFDDRTGRYRDKGTGRFVSERRIRSAVDAVADAASQQMQTAAQALMDGNLSLAAFQSEMQRLIRLSNVAAAVIAKGGAEQMTPADWGRAGRAIRDQYAYLRDFAAQVAAGQQPMDGSLTARARQYGQASRSQYERVRNAGQQQRGFRYERNVLGNSEHCAECVALTGRGWVPIGSLPPVGTRRCRQNDRCRLEYARTIDGERAA